MENWKQEIQAANLDRALSIEHFFKEGSVKITGSDLIKSITKEIDSLERKPCTKVVESQINTFKRAIDGIKEDAEIIIPKTAYEKLNIHG